MSPILRRLTGMTLAAAAVLVSMSAPRALGLALINEIYIDPPDSSGDVTHEYVELRGVPGASLDNHYLIFIESEGDGSVHLGDQGTIDMIFDLNGRAFGPNGFLTLRQKGANAVFGAYTVAAGTTDLVNAGTGVGYGSNTTNSTIGVSVGAANGRAENGAFTAMLIRNDGNPLTNRPVLSFDLDATNDGLDVPTGQAGWTILDSIGLMCEVGEMEEGRSYGMLTFGKDSTASIPELVYADHIPSGGTYVGLEYEIEYIARWGNSAGNAPANWHASNLTLEPTAGFTAQGDFRQSGDPHPPGPDGIVETNHGVPYGTNLTNTLGAPNYPLDPLSAQTFAAGDFDADGDVDDVDLNVEWVRRFGADLSGKDFVAWQRTLGAPGAAAAQIATPEPGVVVLCGIAAALAAAGRRRVVARH